MIQTHVNMAGNANQTQMAQDTPAIVPVTQQATIVKSVSFEIFVILVAGFLRLSVVLLNCRFET